MIPIRVPANGYASIGYTAERLSDQTFWNGTAFVAKDATAGYPKPIALKAGDGVYQSCFMAEIDTSNASAWTDGAYVIYYHRMDSGAIIGADLVKYRFAEASPFLGSGFAIAIPFR